MINLNELLISIISRASRRVLFQRKCIRCLLQSISTNVLRFFCDIPKNVLLGSWARFSNFFKPIDIRPRWKIPRILQIKCSSWWCHNEEAFEDSGLSRLIVFFFVISTDLSLEHLRNFVIYVCYNIFFEYLIFNNIQNWRAFEFTFQKKILPTKHFLV